MALCTGFCGKFCFLSQRVVCNAWGASVPESLRFADKIWIKLRKLETQLRRELAKVRLIGQLAGTRESYERIVRDVKTFLAGEAERITGVPDGIWLALLVFYARYEYISQAFWPTFLQRLGLDNEPKVQNLCRQRFKKAQSSFRHLYFPVEGYTCITPVLYHAVVPQGCVSELADLLRDIGHQAGWDTVVEMELEELAAQLPTVASRAHTTKPLTRFVTQAHSRRLAAELIHDLCDAAYLHQRGELTTPQIEYLLADNPILREVWERMNSASDNWLRSVIPHPLQAAPRWQWDVKSRKLRLFFPRQTLNSPSAPSALVIKKERYFINTRLEKGVWQIEPFSLANLPIDWPDPPSFKAELCDADGRCLRRWNIEPPTGGVLFFQSNQAGLLAFYQDAEKGLVPGDYLVLLRRGLRLEQENAEVSLKYRERPPQGFAEYQAGCMCLQPPLEVFAIDDEKECLQRVPLLPDSPRTLRLEGELLQQADDPRGIAVFTECAPELRIPAQSYEEVKFLQLQLRELTDDENSVADLRSIESLVNADIAVWWERRHELRVQLGSLLLDRCPGRFRVKLLHGLQSAHYSPIEFSLIPALRITPNSDEFEQTLYDAASPPSVEIIAPKTGQLSSSDGEINVVMPGFYEIRWLVQQNDYTAMLSYGQFQLPLRWHPHALRARLMARNVAAVWLTEPLRLTPDDLSFERDLIIEGIEGAEYQIFADATCVVSGHFDEHGFQQFPLARFKENIKNCTGTAVLLRLVVRFHQHSHQLLLAYIFKKSASRNGQQVGEPLASLRIGQQVLHPDYGLGLLETFVDDQIEGEAINLARFHFYQYEGVTIYIPSTRHLPLYSGRREFDVLMQSRPSAPRVRIFTAKSPAKQFEPIISENYL